MIPFVREFDFVWGRCDQVSPLIQRVIARNPGPFTFTGTGTYIVGHSEPGSQVAIIDPGPPDTDHLNVLTACVSGRTVSHILITHTHRDHSPLARPLACAVGGQILAAKPPLTPELRAEAGEEGNDEDFAPDVILVGGEIIKGDGWTIEAMATPGHASNHLAFVLEQENALFCGDHIMGWSTTVIAPPDGDMADYMQSLEAVIARRFQSLWPTHGAPITQPDRFLRAYRAHRMERERQVLEALKVGKGLIADMVPRFYGDIDKRLWPAASLSLHAHLLKLIKEGRVKSVPSPGLSDLYSLT